MAASGSDQAAGPNAGAAPTPDHGERLDAVMDLVRILGARRVIDAGCGPGLLTARLAADPRIQAVQALDCDPGAIRAARARLAGLPPEQCGKGKIACASILDAAPRLAAFRPDLVAMVEVIEHVPPRDHARLEQAVFSVIGAPAVIVTTPNAEFNTVLGVPGTRFRHPDHKFEWTRAQFDAWARAAARRHGLAVRFADLVRPEPGIGGSSQMALFQKPKG